MIVVGDAFLLSHDKCWNLLIDYCKENVRNPKELIIENKFFESED
jgi:hypothetical protein